MARVYRGFHSYLDDGKKYENIACRELNKRGLHYILNPIKRGIDLVVDDPANRDIEYRGLEIKSDTSANQQHDENNRLVLLRVQRWSPAGKARGPWCAYADDPDSMIVYMYDTGKFRGIFAFRTDELLDVVNEMIEKRQYVKREDNTMNLYYISITSQKVIYYFNLTDILNQTMVYTSMDELAEYLHSDADFRFTRLQQLREQAPSPPTPPPSEISEMSPPPVRCT